MKRFMAQMGWPVGVFVAVLSLWYSATKFFEVPAYILPDPLRVVGAGWEKRDNLMAAVRISAVEAGGGFALSVVGGVDRAKMTCIDVEHSTKPLVSGQVDVLMGYLIDEAVALETAGYVINVIPGTAKFVAEKFQPEADLRYQTKSLEKIAAFSSRETGPEKLGMMSIERWAEMCAVFEKSKVLKKPVTPVEMTDFSVLRAIYPGGNAK